MSDLIQLPDGLFRVAGSPVSKVATEAAKTGASQLGLSTLFQGLGPAYAIYSALDGLGFFDKSMEATPMTAEEAALYAGQERLNTVLGSTGEGAGELILDAIEQARAANVTPEQIAETLNTRGDLTSELIGLTVGSNQPFVDTSAAGGGGGGSTAKTAAEEALSNVSAEGGFSEAEANEVYDLIKNGTVTVGEVSSVFNVPEAIINAALETINAERAAAATVDPPEGSTSSLEPDADLMGTSGGLVDSTASAGSTAGIGDTTTTDASGVKSITGIEGDIDITGWIRTSELGADTMVFENVLTGEAFDIDMTDIENLPENEKVAIETVNKKTDAVVTTVPAASTTTGTTTTTNNNVIDLITSGLLNVANVLDSNKQDTNVITGPFQTQAEENAAAAANAASGDTFNTATDSNNTGETLTVGDTSSTGDTSGTGDTFNTATDSNNTGETLTVGDTTGDDTTGDGGDGGGDGTGDGTGNGSGDGTGDGTGIGDGSGSGIGDGTGNGKDGKDGKDGATGLIMMGMLASPLANKIFKTEFESNYLRPEYVDRILRGKGMNNNGRNT